MLKKVISVFAIIMLGVVVLWGTKIYATTSVDAKEASEEQVTQTSNGVRTDCGGVSYWAFCHWFRYCSCGGGF